MASSSSSSPPPPSSITTTITRQDFKQFHAIDRELYARLVRCLGRDAGESMQVMALWLWLERAGQGRRLVHKILQLPFILLNEAANESVTCLKCVETDGGGFSTPAAAEEITLLCDLTDYAVFGLEYFHLNRLRVVRGVTKVLTEVCARAFEDILQQQTSYLVLDCHEGSADAFDFKGQGKVLNPNYSRYGKGDGGTPLPPDERTIFLTFSKGYPITRNEIRDFFNRKFGDVIEAICMQEVGGEEQVLYARLVARSATSVDDILGRRSKAHYSINGKHLWARKYVKKQNKPPPSSVTRSSS